MKFHVSEFLELVIQGEVSLLFRCSLVQKIHSFTFSEQCQTAFGSI